MRKSEINFLIEKLTKYEKQCDDFLEILQGMRIFNFNLDEQQDIAINVNFANWKIFHNDLVDMTNKYKGNLDPSFESFILIIETPGFFRTIVPLRILNFLQLLREKLLMNK